MRKRSVLAMAGTALTTVLVLGGGTAVGQPVPEPPPVTVGPAGGSRAGTRVVISGEGCIDETRTGVVIEATYLGDDADRSFTIPWSDADHPLISPLTVEDDGSWRATYVVQTDDPVGTYGLQATCFNEVVPDTRSMSPFFEYAPATFEVTDEPFVPEMSMSVDPTSGPTGTTITVSGGDCPGGAVMYMLLAGTSRADATHFLSWWMATGDEEGNWSGQLTVPSTMAPLDESARVPVVPGGDYFVIAGCNPDGRVGLFTTEPGSAPVPFEITSVGGETPPVEPPPADLLPSLGVRAPAQPATPVAAQPNYTG